MKYPVRGSTWHGASIEDADGIGVATCASVGDRDRIVACLNACVGIDQPADLKACIALCDAAVKERDALTVRLRNLDADMAGTLRALEQARQVAALVPECIAAKL